MGRFLVFSIPVVTFNAKILISQPTLWPSQACFANFDRSRILSLRLCLLAEPCGKQSACFTSVTSATFTGNAVDTICCHGFIFSLVLMSEFQRLCFEDCPDVLIIPCLLQKCPSHKI